MAFAGFSDLPKLSILFRPTFLCRFCIFLFVTLSGSFNFSLPLLAQSPQFPYKAQVIKQNAYARSGPGFEYYPTDLLPPGQMVEVYRHDPGGWCAIRPPEGSFSWVLARQIEITPDGLGRAKEDQVPVVVGSRLKNLHDVVQVYLKQGELVELLEEQPPGRSEGKGLWYKIAPPSGEFRWIWSQDIAPLAGGPASGSQSAAGTQSPSADGVIPHASEQAAVPAGGGISAGPPGAGVSNAPSGARISAGPAGAPAAGVSGGPSGAGVPDGPPASAVPGGPVGAPGPSAPVSAGLPGGSGRSAGIGLPGAGPTPVTIPPGAGGLSPQEFQEQLRQLELELANRIMAEPTHWQLQDLFTRAESLLGQAPEATSRSEARQLLARISRFIEVQRQYAHILWAGRTESPKHSSAGNAAAANPLGAVSSDQTGAGMPGPAAEASAGVPAGTSSPPATVIGSSPSGQPNIAMQNSPAEGRFDAMGRLTRVVSTKPGAPTYALLDAQGEVVCYLTPAPGINLHPLEGKWIGVNGITGLMLEPRAKHVAVKQIALLDPGASVLR